jgi:dimethylargininase
MSDNDSRPRWHPPGRTRTLVRTSPDSPAWSWVARRRLGDEEVAGSKPHRDGAWQAHRMDDPGRILVRRPSPRLAAGELTHLQRSPVDPDLALAQWQGYVAAFADHGWAVTEIAPADEHPDGVFVEDTVVMFNDLAVITSPGVVSRRGEVDSTAASLDGIGGLTVARIALPGTLDGGDVLKIGRTAYVGQGSRTNPEGVAQLATLIEPRGWRVVPVPVTKVLHLKSGVTALPDGTVIGYELLVDDPHIFPTFLPVPEEHGAAVVDLGDGVVIMSAPRTADLLRGRGLQVVTVPITEFEKLAGCVTCLSVRLRRVAGDSVVGVPRQDEGRDG